MIALIGIPVIATALLCTVQFLLTRKWGVDKAYLILVGIWGLLSACWVISITIFPVDWFSVLSQIPEEEHRIEDGLIIYLVGSSFFALTYFPSSSILAIAMGSSKNEKYYVLPQGGTTRHKDWHHDGRPARRRQLS